jgi:hypothetical protein
MFGNERDIGNKAASELENALNFIKSQGNIDDIGSLREHIQNLQKIGAQLTENGHRTEGSRVSALGRDLKYDLINKLNSSGFEDIATQLQNADIHYINEVLPFYKNKTIRETATTPYQPESVNYSKLLYNPNNKSILNRLSLPAKNATLFETLTKGKYGNELVSMNPEQINKNYSSLPFASRQAIESFNPHLNDTLSSLPKNLDISERLNQGLNQARAETVRLKETSEKERGEAYKRHENASENLKNLNQEEQNIKNALANIISEKFGKPEVKSRGLGAFLNNLSPIHAAGVGFALAPFIGPFASINGIAHLAELGIITAPIARALNKALTNPKTAQHFIKGTRFEKKERIKESHLMKKITQGFSKGALTINNKKNEPL